MTSLNTGETDGETCSKVDTVTKTKAESYRERVEGTVLRLFNCDDEFIRKYTSYLSHRIVLVEKKYEKY